MRRRSWNLLTFGVLLAWGCPAFALDPEQLCQMLRVKAAGTYRTCQRRVMTSYHRVPLGGASPSFAAAVSKCRKNYAARWASFQTTSSLAGSSCHAARFVDNGDGTVRDNLTGLEWEKKTLDASVHNVANPHTWSVSEAAADGSAFTVFLSALNTSPCFTGDCDWRLPTREELGTILADSYTGEACSTPGCIDPIFGPTWSAQYWSSTEHPHPILFDFAWYVSFYDGHENIYCKEGLLGDAYYVRAVRSGL